jgi:two-component system chemotaxis response regulator CheY
MEYAKKRQFKRVPYAGKVTINNTIWARCKDISEGGLFVHLTGPFRPGDTVKVKFSTGLTVMAVVQVVSATGYGLMFTGLKPKQAAGLKALVGRLAPKAGVTGPEPTPLESKPTVLMVEDSENVRQLARKTLEAEEMDVLEATDGMEALRMLGSEVPDLILLDLHMEKMDGYKLLSYIKQIDKLKDIPVLVFSSKYSEEEKAKVKALGADDFLHKTKTTPSKLVSVIKDILGKK